MSERLKILLNFLDRIEKEDKEKELQRASLQQDTDSPVTEVSPRLDGQTTQKSEDSE